MADISRRIANLSAEQRALLERRLEAAGRPSAGRPAAEPLAIIGMGCRFPGAPNPAAFWRLLEDGVDAVTEIPRDRWDADSLYDPDPETPGKMSTRWGGFLDGVEEFDAAFFGIPPREAASMDPQQRLLVEVAWEALEDAGQPVERLAGRAAGVFVGIHSLSSDYYKRQSDSLHGLDVYTSTGVAHSIMANRLSYLLDLRGPSLAVDTACSSSLVAVHLACQSLRLGECDLALAGGVNLILSPEVTVALSKLNMMARDGRCKTFDARADGFVRSEGCGIVVLRRLSDAIADGDPVVAIVRGTAVNQDGATNGITAPSGLAQQAVIRRALHDGRIDGAHVSYVETHGTGTALGDPIEVEALAEAIGEGHGPCFLGAVKSNIGHLEGAAGIAGLVKAALCLRHRFIPPNLHFQQLNPHLDLSRTRFVIPTEGQPWNLSNGAPRLAGISSFGFGGTNAHLVLEEAPVASAPEGAIEGLPLPVPLSARSGPALQALAASYAAFLSDPPRGAAPRMIDVAYTAGMRRSHHRHRAAVVGASTEEWVAGLRELADGPMPSASDERPAPLVFVYPGQGPQWAGMGLELSRSEPVFRARLESADAEIQKLAGWSLLETLSATDAGTSLGRTDVAQPVLLALQAALTDLLRAWGIEPEAVVGHSAGEMAAAYAAGTLGFEQAVRVAVERGRLMQSAAGHGEMAAVELSMAEAEQALAGHDGRLAVASVNGPSATVLSGERASLEEVVAALEARGVRCKRLNVGFAFHSGQMEPFRAELARRLDGLRPQRARLPLFSTLTGRRAEEGDYGPAYWARQIRERVRFDEALRSSVSEGGGICVEVGPDPVLGSVISRCAESAGQPVTTLFTLRRGKGERRSLLETVCALYRLGHPVDWSRCSPPGRRVLPLPTYPWQRERFWIEAARPAPASETPVKRDEALDGLAYAVEWRRREQRPASASSPAPGSWLVLSDRGGVGIALADLLRERGEHCLTVFAEDGSSDGLDRILRQEWKGNGVARRGVVHLWSLDLPPTVEATPASLQASVAANCASIPPLARALTSAEKARLWLVTRGAQAVGRGRSPVAAAQAPLWGFGRALALEQPECWGGLIDLDGSSPVDEARRLLREITTPDGEDQVAYRGRHRYGARLVRAAPAASGGPRLAPGSYLITGGTGALGLRVARWMVQQGARHLVLSSRTGLPDRSRGHELAARDERRHAIESVRDLEAQGAVVTVVAADASDPVAMASVFEAFGRTRPPLRGVVHAAGVVSAATVAELRPAALDGVLSSKVAGGWLLHQLTRDLELDFFVLFSAAAAVLGSRGLAHYAAANELLNALAHHRRALGLPAVAVDWGPWSGGGMAAGDGTSWWLKQMGFEALDPELAVRALGALLTSGETQTVLASVDWSLFRPLHQGRRRRPFLDEIEEGVKAPAHGATDLEEEMQRLHAASAAERREFFTTYVVREVNRLLGFDAGRPVDPDLGFFKAGMDSIMTVQLRNRLEAALGMKLPATVAFEYPTVDALAGYLVDASAGNGVAMGAPAVERKAGSPPTAQLSEEELTVLLAEKLNEMVARPQVDAVSRKGS